MGWVKMKLGDVLKNREGRYKPDDPEISGLKRIDKINFSGQIFLSDKGSNTDMILIKKGDLVISGINVEKGALAVYEGEEDILATIHYSSYIFDTTKIDIDFLKVFLRSPDFVHLLKEQVPGGIKTEIKPKHILSLEVYFPETTTEQKAIAQHFFEKEAKFNQLDEHISYQLTQLENLNQAILQEAVQGKLVPQDKNDEPASELLQRIKAEKAKSGKKEKPLPPIKPEDLPAGKAGIPFEIPENWVWCRLGEICSKITDGTHHSPTNTKTGAYKYVTAKNIKDDGIDLSNITYVTESVHKEIFSRCNPSKGDVLYIKDGATTGIVTINQLEEEFSLLSSVALLKISDHIFNKYLMFSMRSPFFYKATREGMYGVAITRVTLQKINNLLIPVPPLSEQKRIVAEIEKQLAKTKQLKEHIIANQQATEQLLKALLHQAFEVKEVETV